MAGGPIQILDEIEFAPGQRAGFLAALEKRYRPQAEALGPRLRSLLLEPPIDVAGLASRAEPSGGGAAAGASGSRPAASLA